MDYARIGFIGCGSHSTHNLYPMLKYARCRLAAVADIDAEAAERNARIYGAERWYTDADAMLEKEALDGVFVVGSFQMHHDYALKALARGIPVFTEKPPAGTLAGAREMVAAAKAHGTFVMTGFMKRHGLAYAKARELITSGAFEPAAGFFKYAHWHSAPEHLDGMLLFMSIHIIDLAISFFGDVREVTSVRSVTAGTQSLGVTLRFTSGKWAQLMLDGSQPRIQERVELSGHMDGSNALIVVDNLHEMEVHRQAYNGIDVLAPTMAEITPRIELNDIHIWRPDFALPNMGQNSPFIQGFAGEVREFCDAIIEGREPYPGTADVCKAMQVIDAIQRVPDGTVMLEPLAV
jgi:myo-inositol 2-dehydrogenase/D-chiro-inositol 1-dehydrogenase